MMRPEDWTPFGRLTRALRNGASYTLLGMAAACAVSGALLSWVGILGGGVWVLWWAMAVPWHGWGLGTFALLLGLGLGLGACGRALARDWQ